MLQTTLVRGAATLTGLAQAGGQLCILIFHRVLAHCDPLLRDEPVGEEFDRLLQWVQELFDIQPLGEACQALSQGTLGGRVAAITFDDGYRDNYDVAYPILRRRGLSATFFVASAFLGGENMFNDRIREAVRATQDPIDARFLGLGVLSTGDIAQKQRAVEVLISALKYRNLGSRREALDIIEHSVGRPKQVERLMMTPDEIRNLANGGMTVGGHTRSHPILASIDDDEAMEEICGGKDDLEAIVGRPIELFAYPNGIPGRDFESRHAAMARQAGFTYAVTTTKGVARVGCDSMMLPRFTPWGRKKLRFQAQMLRNLFSLNRNS